MANIGDVIDGKYEILKQIGKGGMSRVYLSMDKRLNKQWAVKEITKKSRDKNNEVVVQSAIAEANLIKKLDHPTLPRIVDIIDNGETLYVVMDYIEGEALSKILDVNGAQPEDILIEWAIQLCDVLDYLHTRTPPIIYRDMKPANIMLKPDGNIKLIDFGIAREYKEYNVADTVNMGTRGYAAPEQFGNKGQTDARTDIYCLGVTLYHLVTGHTPSEPPYEIYPIRHWNPQLSAGLEYIIQMCVQQNPEDRFQSCAELMYALQHYQEYSDEYRYYQKKKINTFSTVAVSSLVCLALGFGSLGMNTRAINSNYDFNIDSAKGSSDISEVSEYCMKAYEQKPSEADPLDLLVLKYIEFSDSGAYVDLDNSQISKMYRNGLSTFTNDEDYLRLEYDLGRFYWFYYGDGESDENRNLKEAKEHFEICVELFEEGKTITSTTEEEKSTYNDAKERAVIFYNIANFKTKSNSREKSRTADEYKAYFKDINSMLEFVTGSPDDNIMGLEICSVALNSIKSEGKAFKSSGITKEELLSTFELAKSKLNKIAPNEGLEPQLFEKQRNLNNFAADIENEHIIENLYNDSDDVSTDQNADNGSK